MGLERTVENLRSLYKDTKYQFEKTKDETIYVQWAKEDTETRKEYTYTLLEPRDNSVSSKLIITKWDKNSSDKPQQINIKFISQYSGPIVVGSAMSDFKQGRADQLILRGFYSDQDGQTYFFFGEDTAFWHKEITELESRLVTEIPEYFNLPGCILRNSRYQKPPVSFETFL